MQNTKTKAIVSLVLGIAGCAAVWFGWGAILSAQSARRAEESRSLR